MTVTIEEEIDIGDEISLSIVFMNQAGNPTDPTTITLTLWPPHSGVPAVLTYIDADLDRDGIGQYRYNFVVDLFGTWKFKWQGTGAVAAVEQGAFAVRVPFP